MAVYVVASLTTKDTVRFEDSDGQCCQQWRSMAGDWLRRSGPIVFEGGWPRERLIIAEFSNMEVKLGNGSIFDRVLEMPLTRHAMETVSRIRAMSICRH